MRQVWPTYHLGEYTSVLPWFIWPYLPVTPHIIVSCSLLGSLGSSLINLGPAPRISTSFPSQTFRMNSFCLDALHMADSHLKSHPTFSLASHLQWPHPTTYHSPEFIFFNHVVYLFSLLSVCLYPWKLALPHWLGLPVSSPGLGTWRDCMSGCWVSE